MTRGVLYMVWGDEARALVMRSLASLRQWHPDLPVRVEALDVPEGADPWEITLRKAEMFDRSPYDETLFLDADTVVMGDLSFGFKAARRSGLACCLCENPWLRRYAGLADWGDIPEYNTGVLFFTRHQHVHFAFEHWKEQSHKIDSSSLFFKDDSPEPASQSHNDQAAFGAALWGMRLTPFVLPHNWNFRPQFHRHWSGPLKVWHDRRDVPKLIASAMSVYSDPSAVIRMYEFRPQG